MYQLKNKRWSPPQAATAPSLCASTTHSPQGLLSGQGYPGQQWGEAAITGRLMLSFVTHRTVLLQTVPQPHWAHTAFTVNWRTQKYCIMSLSDLRYSNYQQSLTGNFCGQVCSRIQRVAAFRKQIFDISEGYGTTQVCCLRQKPFDMPGENPKSWQ